MNKQPIVDSLNKKIRRIDKSCVVVDKDCDLSLTLAISGLSICRFADWKKEGFVFETWAFGAALDELITIGVANDPRLDAAQVFHSEGYRLLGGLDND